LADLPLQPLPKNEPEMLHSHEFHSLALGESRLDPETPQQFIAVRDIKRPIHPHLVLLLHFVPGMRENVRQVAVVRHEQQPFAFMIQPAHVVHPRPGIGQQVKDRLPSALIVRGAKVARWFVQHGVKRPLLLQQAAPYFHRIRRPYLRRQVRDHPAIDAHLAGQDEFLHSSTGAETGRR
jgi:hypothetical protein